MAKTGKIQPNEHAPTRQPRWQAPTGRWVEPGQTFRVEGKRGKFAFVAYVVPPKGAPYVEGMDGQRRSRCFPPEAIYGIGRRSTE